MLVMFALTITASLSGRNLTKGLIAGAFGLLARTVGEDEAVGMARFDFGIDALLQGFDFIAVLIGLFAFSQLLRDVRDPESAKKSLTEKGTIHARIEHRAAIREVAKRWTVVVRSALIGVFTGILPGAGGSIANILAYDQAKKASKTPEKFGTGTPEGIIAPESSNNAVEGGALIVLMALGIPGDVTAAVMLGALLIHDIVPSPTFIAEEPVLAYSIFIAFFVATFMMLGLQSFMLRVFVLVTKIRMYMLAGIILGFCGIGVFAINNVEFDLWTLLWFGILGFVMRQFGFPLAPMILGVVLGNIAELNLARAMAITTDLSPFVTRPWSLFFLIIALFSAVYPLFQAHRGLRIWTLFYSPAACLAASVPLFMMGGGAAADPRHAPDRLRPLDAVPALAERLAPRGLGPASRFGVIGAAGAALRRLDGEQGAVDAGDPDLGAFGQVLARDLPHGVVDVDLAGAIDDRLREREHPADVLLTAPVE